MNLDIRNRRPDLERDKVRLASLVKLPTEHFLKVYRVGLNIHFMTDMSWGHIE